jgi:hypothetical protein
MVKASLDINILAALPLASNASSAVLAENDYSGNYGKD